jgi:hypothetical protein
MGLEEGDTHGCQSSFDCFTFTSRKKLRGFATHLDRTIWNMAVTSRYGCIAYALHFVAIAKNYEDIHPSLTASGHRVALIRESLIRI